MFFRRFFFFGLLVLLLVGLFGWSGRSRSESAWMQGYMAGQQSVVQGEAGGTAVSPPPAYYPYSYGPRHVGLGAGLGLIGFLLTGFGFFLVISLLFGLGGIFFRRQRRRRGRPAPWTHHRRDRRFREWAREEKFHRGSPPWYDDDDITPEGPVMKA